ncbi:MAG: hypothetical protein EOP09_19960, partial [Proteobacteria bacterium]
MNKNWIIVGLLAAGLYIYWKNDRRPVERPEPSTAAVQMQSTPVVRERAEPSVPQQHRPQTVTLPAAPVRRVQEIPKGPQNTKRKDVATFVLDEGVAVIHGDLVVGAPIDENPDDAGFVMIPKVDTWQSNVIAYYIQPNVKNPERVLEALEMFHGTAVQFVPFTNQQDVLVFE